ncbi:hypothetical protein D3C76_1375240 [compost metagenome]
MAPDEFCSGMNYDVRTKVNRTKQVWARECVIHDKRNIVLMSNSCYCFNIENVSFRISDSFSIERFGLICNRCTEILRIRRIDKFHGNAQLRKCSGEQIICSAIQRAGSYNLVSSSGNIENGESNRCLT